MAADGETPDPNASPDPTSAVPPAQGIGDTAQGALDTATQFGNQYAPEATGLAGDLMVLGKNTVVADPRGVRQDALALSRGIPAARKGAVRAAKAAATNAQNGAIKAQTAATNAQTAQGVVAERDAALQALKQAEAEQAQVLARQQEVTRLEARLQAAEAKLSSIPPEDAGALSQAEQELASAESKLAQQANRAARGAKVFPGQKHTAELEQRRAAERLRELRTQEELRKAATAERQAANAELTVARSSLHPDAAAQAEANVNAARTKVASFEGDPAGARAGRTVQSVEQRAADAAKVAEKAQADAAALAERQARAAKGVSRLIAPAESGIAAEAGLFSKVSRTFLGAARRVALPVALVAGAVQIYQGYQSGGFQGAKTAAMDVAGMSVGAWAGAEAGAALGAAVGSVVPVVGTAAGALVGGIAGAVIGGSFLSKPIQTAAYGIYHNGINFARQVVHGNFGEAASSLWNGAGAVWNSLWGQQIINPGHAVVPPPVASAPTTQQRQNTPPQARPGSTAPAATASVAHVDTAAEQQERLTAAQNGVAEFGFNSAELGKPEHDALLAKDTDIMKQIAEARKNRTHAKITFGDGTVADFDGSKDGPVALEVEGRVDSVGGNSSRNQTLAQMRAEQAAKVLQEAAQAAGVEVKITAKGAGTGQGADAQAQRAAGFHLATATN